MFVSALIFLGALVLFLSCLWYGIHYRYLKHLKFPGPTLLPIIGNAYHLDSSSTILGALAELKTKYGGIVMVILAFFPPSLVITDTKFLEFLLGTTKVLDKTIEYGFLHGWLGTGLLTSTGNKWRKHRKIITPAFHFKILENFVDVFEKNVKILLEKWEREIGAETFDVYPYVTLLTLDIISETALGTTINAQLNTYSDYVRSVKEMGKILMQRTLNPFLIYDVIYKLSPLRRKEKEAIKALHQLTNSVIKKRKEELKERKFLHEEDVGADSIGIKRKLAFLDLLLQSTIDGEPLSDTDLREEVDTFMFEGHDTTASAISFTLYELSKHPQVQERVMEELNTIFSEGEDRPFIHSDLQNMKYLEAVIKESLRLYPSVPIYGRRVSEDIVFDNILIPKGTQLSIFAYGLLRDPEIYPDPETFNPDRFFLKDDINRNPYSYIPFSAGPRNCIGQRFAMLEMKSAVSHILRKFELLPAEPNYELALVAETTLKSSNGIKIRIKRRSQKIN